MFNLLFVFELEETVYSTNSIAYTIDSSPVLTQLKKTAEPCALLSASSMLVASHTLTTSSVSFSSLFVLDQRTSSSTNFPQRRNREVNPANKTKTGNATNLAIWSTAEPGTGIIAASLVTIRPLVRRFLERSRSDGVPEENGPPASAAAEVARANWLWKWLAVGPSPTASNGSYSTTNGTLTAMSQSDAAMPSALRSAATQGSSAG